MAVPRRTRWLLALAPVVLLLLAEGLAAWLDLAPPPRFFAPENASAEPRIMVPQQRSPWGEVDSLFAGTRFAMPRPEGVLRLFCVGASTVRGFPFDPNISFPRWLQARLTAEWPERTAEVLVCAANGRNADAVAELVEEVVQYQPDAILVYTGHNELHLWNRGLLEPGRRHQLRRLLGCTHLGRLLLAASGQDGGFVREVESPAADPNPPVAAPAALRGIVFEATLSEETWRAAFSLFEDALERMRVAAKAAGVPLLLSHLVANSRDFPPSVSVIPDTEAGRRARNTLQQAREVLEQARPAATGRLPLESLEPGCFAAPALAEAAELLEATVRAAPRAAVAYFLLGRCRLGLGDVEGAIEALKAALEHDGHPVRAVDRFQIILVTCSGRDGVQLIDPRPEFLRAARDGVPGADLFVDNVHPNLPGQRVLAQVFLRGLGACGLIPESVGREEWAQGPLAQAWEDRLDLAETRRHLARKLSKLGLLSLTSAVAHGTDLRWGPRQAFPVALDLDSSCAEAQLGQALVDLAYSVGQDPIGRIRTVVSNRADLVSHLGQLAKGHEEWRRLLQPVFER